MPLPWRRCVKWACGSLRPPQAPTSWCTALPPASSSPPWSPPRPCWTGWNSAGGQPRLAYHAAFDQLALERASLAWLGLKDRTVWLDLAVLAPLLVPRGPGFDRPLDDWLAHFHIPAYQRHGALADAYATAQLWLTLLPAARAQNLTHLKQLVRLSRQVRWLNTHPG